MSSINDQASDSDSDHGHGQSRETSGKTKPVRAKVPTSTAGFPLRPYRTETSW
jgi:hypothetical protein